jgi:hypothetical protein
LISKETTMSAARSGAANLDPKVLAALMYSYIWERVMTKDAPHLDDLQYRTGLLRDMNVP